MSETKYFKNMGDLNRNLLSALSLKNCYDNGIFFNSNNSRVCSVVTLNMLVREK